MIFIMSESGSIKFTFHPIEAIRFSGEDEETQTFVKFSPLVTKSIKDGTFQLFNHQKLELQIGHLQTVS